MKLFSTNKIWILGLFLLAFSYGKCGVRPVDEKPNIVLIVADDLGFADLSMNGSNQIPTPHIDRLAKEGVNFTQGYVSAPVCAPSRAGLITGKNQVKFGFDNNLATNLKEGKPHQSFNWRFTISAAIRDGDWKLVRLPDRLPMLYNLAEDISEQNDVALQNHDRTKTMLKELGQWDVRLPRPVFLEGAVWKSRQLDLYDDEYFLVQPE